MVVTIIPRIASAQPPTDTSTMESAGNTACRRTSSANVQLSDAFAPAL